jgi:hypothetical protein
MQEERIYKKKRRFFSGGKQRRCGEACDEFLNIPGE